MGGLYPGSGWIADYGYLTGTGVSVTPPRYIAFRSYPADRSFTSYVGNVAFRSYVAVTAFLSWER